jgi:adhesin transport system outer membrane protein
MHKPLVTVMLLVLLATPLRAGQQPLDQQDGLLFAIRSASRLHPLVKSKLDSLTALGFDLKSAKAQRYPVLAVQAESMSDENSQVFARMQQPLWVGGRISGSIDKAEALQQVGSMTLLEVKRQLIEETAVTYANLIGLRKRVRAAELNVQEHQRLLDMIDRRAVGSIASQADVHLANSRLAQAIAQREQLKGQMRRAMTDLQSLTQLRLSGNIPVPEDLFIMPERNRIEDLVVAASATVKLRSREVEVARSEVKLSKAGMMPSLYARVDQDIYRATEDGRQDSETRAGLVLEGSFEGAGLFGWRRVKAAGAQVDAALRNVDAARNDVRRRVWALIGERDSQRQILRVNKILVAATGDALESFMRQYEAGRKSWVDVLNAQREFATARLTLEQTASSLQQTDLRLAVQMGLLDEQAGVEQ